MAEKKTIGIQWESEYRCVIHGIRQEIVSYGALVPGCWAVPGLRCASGSAIPPVTDRVRALLSLCSGTPPGLLKVSSRFIVVWILWAVWLSSVVFSLKIISCVT